MEEYIILELIPTAVKGGDVIQLSALKLKGLNLVDRFDYRLVDENVPLKEMREMISYDKEDFTYKESTKEIIDDFKQFCGKLKLLILEENYTLNYLSEFENNKESILNKLNMEYSDNVIDEIIAKYKLQASNYITDILYEALIYESNNK